jgi:hypothetical protein
MTPRPRLSLAQRLHALCLLPVAHLGVWAAGRQVERAAEYGTREERLDAFDHWAELCLHLGQLQRAVRG